MLINNLHNLSKNLSCSRKRASSTLFLPGSRLGGNLIQCAQKDNAVAHYAIEGLPNKVLAAECKTVLMAAVSIAKTINERQRGLGAKIKTRNNTKPDDRKNTRGMK